MTSKYYCPFCGKVCIKTNSEYVTQGRVRQYFHIDCFNKQPTHKGVWQNVKKETT